MNKNKGFTLIELLVVISIIGILAVIVLSSLSSAGEKGANAGIKSNGTSIRSQAGVYWVSKGQSYLGFCDPTNGDAINNASLLQAKDTAKTTGGTIAGGIIRDGSQPQTGNATDGNAPLYCYSDVRNYVVSLPLRAVERMNGIDNNFWCVDSKGFVGGIKNGIVAGGKNCSQQLP